MRVLAGERPVADRRRHDRAHARRPSARALGTRRTAASRRQRRAVPGAVRVGALPVVHRRGAHGRARPGRAHRRPAGPARASAAAPSGASPSGCGSRRSSPTSRRVLSRRPRPARWTSTSRRGSGASWRTWASTGPPCGRFRTAAGGVALTHAWTREGVPPPPSGHPGGRGARGSSPGSVRVTPSALAAARGPAGRGGGRSPEPRRGSAHGRPPWSPWSRAARWWAASRSARVREDAPLARRVDRRGSGSWPTSSPTRWRGSGRARAAHESARSRSGTWPGG